MNKKLSEVVKAKCKDMGLNEEFVNTITEQLGGSIAEDSTDEKAIEQVATLIENVAKAAQGEATRWSQKAKKTITDPTPAPNPTPTPAPTDEPKGELAAVLNELKQMREDYGVLKASLDNMQAETAKKTRASLIQEAMTKHNIPETLRTFVTPSDEITDDKLDDHIAKLAQELVTSGLPSNLGGEKKVQSEEAIKQDVEDYFKSHYENGN